MNLIHDSKFTASKLVTHVASVRGMTQEDAEDYVSDAVGGMLADAWEATADLEDRALATTVASRQFCNEFVRWAEDEFFIDPELMSTGAAIVEAFFVDMNAATTIHLPPLKRIDGVICIDGVAVTAVCREFAVTCEIFSGHEVGMAVVEVGHAIATNATGVAPLRDIIDALNRLADGAEDQTRPAVSAMRALGTVFTDILNSAEAGDI